MRSNLSPVRGASVSRPRFIASVGEYLGAEAIHWCQQAFGQPIHETWSQTETGAIMIANFAAEDIKPGSIGQPIPGVEAAVVERRDDNHVAIVREPGRLGELAIRAGWPSMFRLYVQDADRYGQCFLDGWYMTGDFVTRDAEGYYWFVGRSDDVIKSGGHLIGPVEVESALLGHPAVAEAAVIGKPEAILGETIKAYVVLKGTREPEDALRRSILGEARKRLGRALAPSELEFRDWLPRTKNGNIMRRSLRAQELGLPVDDVPTAAAQS
jgi:acetyl-CoA synthetase